MNEQYKLDYPDEFNHLKIGDNLPTFIRDGEISKELSGTRKPLLLIFFSSDCRHCRNSFAYLEKNIFPAIRSRIDIIGIGRDCSFSDINEYRKEHRVSIDLIPDSDRSIYSGFAERSVPRIYLFNTNGKLVHSVRGYKPSEIERILTIPL
jgi:thioredoxin-related protein